ncbi:MAG: Mur ligase, partial [Psychrosphaera sp.]|nr:Mur ligase [Psychrosphaera sp.]
MNAIVSTTNNMPSKRKWVMLSAGGDRSDEDITVMTEAAMVMKPDHLMSAELHIYLRGRAVGTIPNLMGNIAKKHGLPDDAIHTKDSPFEAAKFIIDNLQEGDLALLLVLAEREEIVELIEQYM